MSCADGFKKGEMGGHRNMSYCWLGDFRVGAYLWAMKKLRLLFLLAFSTPLLLASCSQPPDAEKDPNADAAYKRSHRTEGYREAQRSNTNY